MGNNSGNCTEMAIAAAKQLSSLGSRVLLVGQDPSPTLGMILGVSLEDTPTEIAPNLSAVQLISTVLLEQSWEEVKALEAKYLRSPLLKNVYGQELGVLPGMDSALALNAIRQYDQSAKYDVIIYDGIDGMNTVRMLGIPEVLSWYIRRFRNLFLDSDLVKAISPFIQPVTSAILNVTWTADNIASEPTNEANEMLDRGKAAIGDPTRVAAYLVTEDSPEAIVRSKYLWGSAQQVNLTVGGVFLKNGNATDKISEEFAPLTVTSIPSRLDNDWQPLIDALPNLKQTPTETPKSITIDTREQKVHVFLPGFDKKDVKLTQYGPEITIEAGNQRRNIDLPPSLSGKPVKGAKFQNGYLIISF